MAPINTLYVTKKVIFAVLILLSVVSTSAKEVRKCYWCGPLADQVHRSRRAPYCDQTELPTTTCDEGYTHCATVAVSPPYVESRICVKFYQDECYSLYCNSTQTWRMVCTCQGDLCNGLNTERETTAFSTLTRSVKKNKPKNKRSLNSKFINLMKPIPPRNDTLITTSNGPDMSDNVSDMTSSGPDSTNSVDDMANNLPDTTISMPDMTDVKETANSMSDTTKNTLDISSSVLDNTKDTVDTTNSETDMLSSAQVFTNSMPDPTKIALDASNSVPDIGNNLSDMANNVPDTPSMTNNDPDMMMNDMPVMTNSVTAPDTNQIEIVIKNTTIPPLDLKQYNEETIIVHGSTVSVANDNNIDTKTIATMATTANTVRNNEIDTTKQADLVLTEAPTTKLTTMQVELLVVQKETKKDALPPAESLQQNVTPTKAVEKTTVPTEVTTMDIQNGVMETTTNLNDPMKKNVSARKLVHLSIISFAILLHLII